MIGSVPLGAQLAEAARDRSLTVQGPLSVNSALSARLVFSTLRNGSLPAAFRYETPQSSSVSPILPHVAQRGPTDLTTFAGLGVGGKLSAMLEAIFAQLMPDADVAVPPGLHLQTNVSLGFPTTSISLKPFDLPMTTQSVLLQLETVVDPKDPNTLSQLAASIQSAFARWVAGPDGPGVDFDSTVPPWTGLGVVLDLTLHSAWDEAARTSLFTLSQGYIPLAKVGSLQ